MRQTSAFPVTEASHVAVPRRTVLKLAEQLGFSDARAGATALIVSELATNLTKHAREGEILLRPLHSGNGERNGIQIIAVDKGPGMSNSAQSRSDGYSTSGSLGYGLGTIERQSDFFDFYTDTTGTAIVASIWREETDRRVLERRRYDVGAVHVAKPGEDVCGDAWCWRARDGRLAILVADGLGHGLYAHDAAEAAVSVFRKCYEYAPARVIENIHGALRATRGAAVAMLAVDNERGTASYAGLGNITSSIIVSSTASQHLVSHNGTAGHSAARIQEFQYPVPAGSVITLASDGLRTNWSLDAYPGLRTRSASVIAAILYRDFNRRRDDVTLVVAADRPPSVG
jgi:anti-sigma regulatory factor (Ser/Thr protein kinase)